MTSPARQHFQRATAAAASAATEYGEPIHATGYELVMAQLAEDRRRLKAVQSIERRIEAKRTMLTAYEPWVQGALSAGRGGQDAVLMTVMVWKIDVDDFAGALDIAEYALQHDLVLPDQFQRDVATLVAEEIAEKALQLLPSDAPVPVDVLNRVIDLTQARDMPDEVRAKVMKAVGLEYARLTEVAGDEPPLGIRADFARMAVGSLRRALALHEKVGVKKDIERVERWIKNNPPSTNVAGVQTDAAATPPGTAPPPAAGVGG